jgi:hypothetical protein
MGTKNTVSSEESSKGIDSILITYFCGDVNTGVAIKCEKIAKIQIEHPTNDYSLFGEEIVEAIDTFIVDKTILDKIKPLLEKKKTIINYNEDSRMYVTVKYTNNTKDNICLGMETPQVMFNGESMLIENELVYLLRAYSGYYKWFDMEDLSFFKEYQSFNR